MIVLGAHGGVMHTHHDAAAVIICDGKLVSACEEERFTRSKGAFGFLPINSVKNCIKTAGISIEDVDLLVHTGETHPDLESRIRSYMNHYFGYCPPIRLISHQMAHLASAYYCSGFEESMCVSCDGYGDEMSAALAVGSPQGLKVLETRDKDNSLGQFYAAITSFLGFLVSEDEYKIMGLAAFGEPGVDLADMARPAVDGYTTDSTFWWNTLRPISRFETYYGHKLVQKLGQPRRWDEPITQKHKNIAYAAQSTLEDCFCGLVKYLHERTGLTKICLAGGVALNCSANFKISQLPFIEDIFVQPASSDRGLALGCALWAAFEAGEPVWGLEHVNLGPHYQERTILTAVEQSGLNFQRIEDPPGLAARMLAHGKIIAWYQGRSEYGPRALGQRSILADPRPRDMKDRINSKIKFREEFRPFAPAVMEEKAHDVFDLKKPSPFMTVAYPVKPSWRGKIPAVTHVNDTSRVQTVNQQVSPHFHKLISDFEKITATPLVLNTSFNVRGEPIVETPRDAIATFASTGLDALFIGPFLVHKNGTATQ